MCSSLSEEKCTTPLLLVAHNQSCNKTELLFNSIREQTSNNTFLKNNAYLYRKWHILNKYKRNNYVYEIYFKRKTCILFLLVISGVSTLLPALRKKEYLLQRPNLHEQLKGCFSLSVQAEPLIAHLFYHLLWRGARLALFDWPWKLENPHLHPWTNRSKVRKNIGRQTKFHVTFFLFEKFT